MRPGPRFPTLMMSFGSSRGWILPGRHLAVFPGVDVGSSQQTFSELLFPGPIIKLELVSGNSCKPLPGVGVPWWKSIRIWWNDSFEPSCKNSVTALHNEPSYRKAKNEISSSPPPPPSSRISSPLFSYLSLLLLLLLDTAWELGWCPRKRTKKELKVGKERPETARA